MASWTRSPGRGSMGPVSASGGWHVWDVAAVTVLPDAIVVLRVGGIRRKVMLVSGLVRVVVLLVVLGVPVAPIVIMVLGWVRLMHTVRMFGRVCIGDLV